MKAIRVHAYGGAELMQLDDAPLPACGAADVLVRVVAAGVNPIDWKVRSGAMAAQLAKEQGAHVTATASGAGLALVKSLGADEVIDYRTQRFEQIARGMDIVLDTLGGPTQAASWATLRPGGILGRDGHAAAARTRGKMVLHVGAPGR